MKALATRARQHLAYLKDKPSEIYFHFEIRHASPYKRPPLHQTMMVDDQKVMYLPIAKNACSSLKRIVAELGGLQIGGHEDIHHKLDNENTGLMFFNRNDEDIETALSQSGWMRFVILRDPLERLVSAYIEKFVVNRMAPGVRITCDPVLMRRRKLGFLRDKDYRRGITFRSFVQDIVSQPPNLLDPHWRPQAQYLKAFPYTHLYRIEGLHRLVFDLSDHIGCDIQIPVSNVSRASDQGHMTVPGASELLPGDLPAPERLSVDSFIHGTLRRQLLKYYAKDVELYASSLP